MNKDSQTVRLRVFFLSEICSIRKDEKPINRSSAEATQKVNFVLLELLLLTREMPFQSITLGRLIWC